MADAVDMLETPEEIDVPEALDETPPVDEYTPPSKEEWAKVQNALAKDRADAKKHREALKALKESQQTDDEAKIEEATKATAAKYRKPLVNTALKSALAEAGLKGDATKYLKLIDTDAIDLDDDGELTGVDEQVSTFKSDFPELFDGRKQRPAPIDGAPRTPLKKELTYAEKISAQLGM